jgi:hypothetical protein
MKTLASSRDKAELLRRLKEVRPDTARRWGRMSPHQMVCHLTDAFRFAMGQKPANDVSTVATRTIVKWIALYAPARWPQGIVTVPEIDQQRAGTPPIEFAADVAELERIVDSISAHARAFAWEPRHPIFGRMSESDWLRWSYLHMDHHLRQFGV